MVAKLLVTGAGRSGTHWLASCLQRAGVDQVTHEYAFIPERPALARHWTCEVSWPAAAYLPLPEHHGAEVAHLVRHPLDVIASLVARKTFGRPSTWGRWAADVRPLIRDGATELERAAIYWAEWTSMVEANAPDYMLRVEEVVPDDVATLAHVVLSGARPAPPVLPPPIDTSDHPSLSWGDLGTLVRPEVCWRVAELAERYGYR